MPKYSLLSEPIFSVAVPQGAALRLSLPEVLSRLAQGDDLQFTTLRPHQRAPWHAFLVQLAFLALEGDEAAATAATPDIWAQRLRGLTSSYLDDAPWCLVNADWQSPAFLQAPCSAAHVADFVHAEVAAQDFDVLVTSRHHDEKIGKLRLASKDADTAAYALITLQGWTGGLGRGNYNSMRVNGYHASRPQFRLTYDRGTGPEFSRDLNALREGSEILYEQADALGMGVGTTSPVKLLWLAPWDRGSLQIADIHPLCLEVSRRVRLVEQGGQLKLLRASSDGMRVDAESLCAVVADPWVPIVLGAQPKALNTQANGFSYAELHKRLFDSAGTALPLLAKPSASERRLNRPATMAMYALVYGQGKTDGLLVRELLMPAPILTMLVTAPARLAQRSQLLVGLASLASRVSYRTALMQFVGGRDKVEQKNRDFVRVVKPWVDRFEQAIDEAFFGHLFATIADGLDDTDAQRRWAQWLAACAQRALNEATQSLPTRDGSRLFAQVRAERRLRASLRKQFGSLLAAESAQRTESGELPCTDEAAHE